MSKVELKLNRAGVKELLKSEGVMSACAEVADSICSRCGDGYVVSKYTGKNRVNASVYAKSIEARVDNAKHNTLLKAMKR